MSAQTMPEATSADEASTFDSLKPSGAVRPGLPIMLSHAAYVTHDTAATARFFERVLGMEMVNAVLDDAIPSTGEPVTYFHSFFR